MHIRPTKIEGLRIIELEQQTDSRGSFSRTFCELEFAAAGIPFRIVQVNLSLNRSVLTLRGMHYQETPHGEPKVVSCLKGRIFDVVVDLRRQSPTFLQWEAVELAPEHGQMLYLAEGLAHGFMSLEPDSEVQYFMGAPYVPEAARGVRWDDPAIGIAWPAVPEVISERDRDHPLLKLAK